MRRHGDDRDVGLAGHLPPADGNGRLQAIHLGHLHVHQNQIEPPFVKRTQRFQPVVGDEYLMAFPLQQRGGYTLIDDVVFGKQNL